jgi:hypothetical protein
MAQIRQISKGKNNSKLPNFNDKFQEAPGLRSVWSLQCPSIASCPSLLVKSKTNCRTFHMWRGNFFSESFNVKSTRLEKISHEINSLKSFNAMYIWDQRVDNTKLFWDLMQDFWHWRVKKFSKRNMGFPLPLSNWKIYKIPITHIHFAI